MIANRNRKKGSALITTVMVALLVCALVGTMLSLSLWDKTLAKTAEKEVAKQNQLDMLTDMFLKYNIAPENTFGYSVNVFYYEDGTSTMTVRAKETSPLCTMLVSQRNGEMIERYYDVPYEHTEATINRTIGIHNEADTNPHLKLRLPKSEVSSNGPFYVYGKIKLERAVGINSKPIRAYVNMSMNGGAQTTVMTLSANTDGWVNLHNTDGSPLKFNSVPSTSLDFLFGLDNTSGELVVADLVVVNSKNVVCYSLANDPFLSAVGDVRNASSSLSYWSRNNFSHKFTTAPIVTRDIDNYVPNTYISITQPNYTCHGEPFLALYKSGIREKAGAGYYYITGRFRTKNITRAELCDAAGGNPNAQFIDVHSDYERIDGTRFESNYAGVTKPNSTNKPGVNYATNDSWMPLIYLARQTDLNSSAVCTGYDYMKFYVPADCERVGEDYIKFTLWAAQGTFELADIRVYKLSSATATPNPASDQLVYDMNTDPEFAKVGNQEFDGCALNGETNITKNIWTIHWLSYQNNANLKDALDYSKYPGDFKANTIINPNKVTHTYKDFDALVFPNKKGDTYDPKK